MGPWPRDAHIGLWENDPCCVQRRTGEPQDDIKRPTPRAATKLILSDLIRTRHFLGIRWGTHNLDSTKDISVIHSPHSIT